MHKQAIVDGEHKVSALSWVNQWRAGRDKMCHYVLSISPGNTSALASVHWTLSLARKKKTVALSLILYVKTAQHTNSGLFIAYYTK